jgi:hypothetical protein
MDSLRYSVLVAQGVRTALEKAGISRLAAAEKSGIPRTTLNRRLDNPETSSFTIRELHDLSKVAKTPVQNFLHDPALAEERES